LPNLPNPVQKLTSKRPNHWKPKGKRSALNIRSSILAKFAKSSPKTHQQTIKLLENSRTTTADLFSITDQILLAKSSPKTHQQMTKPLRNSRQTIADLRLITDQTFLAKPSPKTHQQMTKPLGNSRNTIADLLSITNQTFLAKPSPKNAPTNDQTTAKLKENYSRSALYIRSNLSCQICPIQFFMLVDLLLKTDQDDSKKRYLEHL
jgi:hypothetical protein